MSKRKTYEKNSEAQCEVDCKKILKKRAPCLCGCGEIPTGIATEWIQGHNWRRGKRKEKVK